MEDISMHGIRILLIATASALITTSGFAASLDSLVIHGAPAKKVLEKFALSIDSAKRIAATCVDYAKQHNIGVSIAIMDPSGEMIYFERMDGQTKINTITAVLKAKTALVTRASTHLVNNAVAQGNASEFRAGYFYGEFPIKGGLPIVAEDQFLGAIGVTGSLLDEECANAGLEAVIGPQPPLVENLPPRRPAPANGP
jgi:glc operon protein GlcG